MEWVTISFPRESSRPRDRTQVSPIDRQTLYCLSHQGSPTQRRVKTQVRSLASHALGSGASQVVLVVKNITANAGDIRDAGLIPALGRPPGGGHDNPLQYSCLENPTDRGDWRATVHGVTQSWTGLTNKSSHGGSVAADLRKENEYLLIASECQTWG